MNYTDPVLCIISRRYCVVGNNHHRDCYADCPVLKCYGTDTTGDTLVLCSLAFTKSDDFVKYGGKVLTSKTNRSIL